MSMTRGSGGFSISPALTFNYVVSSDTEPFKLLDRPFGFDPVKFFYCGLSTADVRATLDLVRRKLFRLYQEGNASPSDVDENGNTVMHVRHWCKHSVRFKSC